MTKTYFAKKKKKTMLIWVITDQEIRRRYFWSWLHVMIGGLQIMTRSLIDTSNNKIGIFANILGLFNVLQYCLPFKLRLQKTPSPRIIGFILHVHFSSMILIEMTPFLQAKCLLSPNIDSLYFVGFIIFLYAQPSNYVLSLRARCIDNKRKFSQQ